MNTLKLKYWLYALAGCFVFGAATVTSPAPVGAAECGKHEKVIAFLGKKYKEQLQAMGLVSNKGFMQLFVAETGTWTVILTTPQGISCIVAAGDNYETNPTVAKLEPNA